LPLVFCNNGEQPILIDNLRLRFSHESEDTPPLRFNTTQERRLDSPKHKDFSRPFTVPPLATEGLVCQFQRRPSNFRFEPEPTEYQAWLEALIKAFWVRVCDFRLSIPHHKFDDVNKIYTIIPNMVAANDQEDLMSGNSVSRDELLHLRADLKDSESSDSARK
jgi:hypothetical protein